MKKNKVIIFVTMMIFFCTSLWLLGKVLQPKYVTNILEGSLIKEYYASDKNHDVIFIGDCEVYENFSPITLWQEYGITSYIRGSAQQLIWQSYYLLEETLKYEKPEVVVFNVLSMKYDKPQKEAYNRMTLDGMKLSRAKLKSIAASMLPEESFIEYLFPILRYHSRWSDLTKEDFQYAFKDTKVSHNGYLMRVDEKPVTAFRKDKELPSYEFSPVTYYYLDKLTELCKKNDIELVLIKAPTIWPYWYKEWDEQMVDYANKNNLLYINFLDYVDEIGIDFKKDTYDSGLHLNLTGAEKLSKYFGQILKTNYNIDDNRQNKEISKSYQENINDYEETKRLQYEELEEYGYLKSFGGIKPN